MTQAVKKEFNWFPLIILGLLGFVCYSFISGGLFLGIFSLLLVGWPLLF